MKNAITGTKYIAPQTWSTNGTWNNGVPYTAQEIAVDDSATQDEVGNRHDNVWLMNSAMDPTGWLAATGNYGLAFVNNSTDYYGLTIHVGLFSGDSARYPLN